MQLLENLQEKRSSSQVRLLKTFGFDTDETITKADKESLSRILTQTDLPAKRIDNYINKLNTIKRKFYFSDVE